METAEQLIEQGRANNTQSAKRLIEIDRLERVNAELVRALKELLELLEISDMSSRDLPEHEYGSIVEEAEKQARVALRNAKGEV